MGAEHVRSKDEERVIQVFLEEMGAALFSCGLPLHGTHSTCVHVREGQTIRDRHSLLLPCLCFSVRFSVVEFYLTLAAHRLKLDISIVAISTSFWITFAPSSTAHMVMPVSGHTHKPASLVPPDADTGAHLGDG